MKIIGIGNLACDLYYKNNILIGINGGKSFSNIIFNLANMGHNTSIIGECGNDIYGNTIINSLKSANVNTQLIEISSNHSNLFHINLINNYYITTKKCPLCNSKYWINFKLKNTYNIKNNIIIFDDINYVDSNNSLIKNNMIMLDAGYYNYFENSLSNINNLLETNFEIINMNDKVSKYLICILNLKNEQELFNKLNSKLLIITRNKSGASFYSKNINLNLKPNSISDEVDSNGAGDMFFASFINLYICNNFIINERFIKHSFYTSNILSSKVVQLIGSRTYFQNLYNVKKINCLCTCKNLIMNKY